MGDAQTQNEPYEIASTAHDDTLQIFSIVSPMDEILTHLLALTSYITRRFVRFIEDLIARDVDRFLTDHIIVPQRVCSSYSGWNRQRSVSEGSSSSIAASNSRDGLLIDRTSDVETIYSYEVASPIFEGLMLPLYGLQFVQKLASCSLRNCFSCIRCVELCLYNIMCRIRKTLLGSSNDIGWLQTTPGMPPVVDGTARFLELLSDIRNGEHKLPNSFVYLLIPGLFSNHGPLYFVGTKKFFSKMGLTCHIAKIHSEASVEHNAWELKEYVEELYWGSGKRVMLLGHSKGGVDAAAALSIYCNELKDKVAGLALVQSPYGGTPLASDFLRDGQVADKETRKIMELLICKIIKGDIRALEDLTYDKRKEFIMNHNLPENVPILSFHSEAQVAPGVLATMTHIAHAELPWLPLPRSWTESDTVVQGGRRVPVVIPLSAVMALCALHLQLRYGEKSDGLVTCRDAEVPGSVVVRPNQKLDHGWMVYSSKKKSTGDPDACEMCEAILTLLVELGMRMKQVK
ncbi:uncharacterized protein E6C27_scaffold41G00980 [Cucumis melo var. makuwa]|uniref:Alpha/beta-Hydrolases superfamily protein n=1 Tax=Cucumis melo var. makuwa TaxID=1194695 RepID=A0A5A7V3T9_CUCMM|nr:uncharacterized protein E6C27_scaffold41G00980 [Cucumis melo var. makuwa]